MAQSFGNGRQPAITRKIIEERKASTQNFADAPPVDHAVGEEPEAPRRSLDFGRLGSGGPSRDDTPPLEPLSLTEVPSAGERQREGDGGQIATDLQGEGGLSDSQHE